MYINILQIYVCLVYLFCLFIAVNCISILESENALLVNTLAGLCEVFTYLCSSSGQQKEKLSAGKKQLELLNRTPQVFNLPGPTNVR